MLGICHQHLYYAAKHFIWQISSAMATWHRGQQTMLHTPWQQDGWRRLGDRVVGLLLVYGDAQTSRGRQGEGQWLKTGVRGRREGWTKNRGKDQDKRNRRHKEPACEPGLVWLRGSCFVGSSIFYWPSWLHTQHTPNQTLKCPERVTRYSVLCVHAVNTSPWQYALRLSFYYPFTMHNNIDSTLWQYTLSMSMSLSLSLFE